MFTGSEIEWLTPQSEYRPTEYVQGWLNFWFDEAKRLTVAKTFQQARVSYLQCIWEKDRDLKAENFFIDDSEISSALDNYAKQIPHAVKTGDLLQKEALLTKQLYRYAAKSTKLGDFVREREATDLANGFLNHGNYLAYGLAATTLWVLGIPHGFAVMHGKTRRGALVFDVADLIKDAIVLPSSFPGPLSAPKKKPPNRNFASKSCKNSPNTKLWTLCLNRLSTPLTTSSLSLWERAGVRAINHDGDLCQPMREKSLSPHPPRPRRLRQPHRR